MMGQFYPLVLCLWYYEKIKRFDFIFTQIILGLNVKGGAIYNFWNQWDKKLKRLPF